MPETNPYINCPQCGGSGSVMVTYGDHPTTTDEDCPRCDELDRITDGGVRFTVLRTMPPDVFGEPQSLIRTQWGQQFTVSYGYLKACCRPALTLVQRTNVT
jgi:hypothetical protein